MQSNVVAVPKSTTMVSRRSSCAAAGVVGMRAAPTFSGASPSSVIGKGRRAAATPRPAAVAPPPAARQLIQSPRQKPRPPAQIFHPLPIRARQHLEFSCNAKRVPEFRQRTDGDVKEAPILSRAVFG